MEVMVIYPMVIFHCMHISPLPKEAGNRLPLKATTEGCGMIPYRIHLWPNRLNRLNPKGRQRDHDILQHDGPTRVHSHLDLSMKRASLGISYILLVVQLMYMHTRGG